MRHIFIIYDFDEQFIFSLQIVKKRRKETKKLSHKIKIIIFYYGFIFHNRLIIWNITEYWIIVYVEVRLSSISSRNDKFVHFTECFNVPTRLDRSSQDVSNYKGTGWCWTRDKVAQTHLKWIEYRSRKPVPPLLALDMWKTAFIRLSSARRSKTTNVNRVDNLQYD